MTGSPAPRQVRNASPRAIVLTSHPPRPGRLVPLRWGAAEPLERGPVIATLSDPEVRNVIGTHAGSYALYRALAVAAGPARVRPPAGPDQHHAGRTHRAVPAMERARARSCRSIHGAT